MARKTIVELIDDIDGSRATGTIEFGLDGVTYEIDLNDENSAKMRGELSAWIEKARRIGGRRHRGGSSASTGSKDTAKIRAWAREKGYTVSDRGRISADIRRAYYDAH